MVGRLTKVSGHAGFWLEPFKLCIWHPAVSCPCLLLGLLLTCHKLSTELTRGAWRFTLQNGSASSCVVCAANIRSMYKTVYQAAFWTMQKTDQQLPDDLNELLKHLAVTKQQQAAQQQQAAPQQQQQQQQPDQPPPLSAAEGQSQEEAGAQQ